MKRLSIVILVVILSVGGCVSNQEKGIVEEIKSSSFQPNPLDDEWSKWIVGEWKGSAEIGGAKSNAWTKIELGLNGQFLIMKWENEITYEQIQQLKEIMPAPDEDMEGFLSSSFKELEIRTIDTKTGELTGYLFDSLRCIAKGTGRWEGNQEIMEWQWSGQGQGTSIRTTKKVGDDKFIVTQKYTLPDGSIMEDSAEMTRKK